MLICLATYEERLASLFENASSFKLYELQEGKAVHKADLVFPGTDPATVGATIAESGTDMLICGGISGSALTLLEQQGVQVSPWIRGAIPEVLEAAASGNLTSLAMPGVQGGPGRGPGKGLGNGQGRGAGRGGRGQGGAGRGAGRGGRGMGRGQFAPADLTLAPAATSARGAGLGLGPCGMGRRRGNGPERQANFVPGLGKTRGGNS